MWLRLLFSDFFARRDFIFSVENLEVSSILLERERKKERKKERMTILNTLSLFLLSIISFTFLLLRSVKVACTYISHITILTGRYTLDIVLFSGYKNQFSTRFFTDAGNLIFCRAFFRTITCTHFIQKLQYLTDREILVVFKEKSSLPCS